MLAVTEQVPFRVLFVVHVTRPDSALAEILFLWALLTQIMCRVFDLGTCEFIGEGLKLAALDLEPGDMNDPETTTGSQVAHVDHLFSSATRTLLMACSSSGPPTATASPLDAYPVPATMRHTVTKSRPTEASLSCNPG